MLKNERFKLILSYLNKKGSVTTAELVEKLKISEATVRRDVNELGNMGKLNKVFGGATSLDENFIFEDEDIDKRYADNSKGEDIIAKHAVSLINSRDFIYLDAGSSVEAMIKYMEASVNASFVTDSVNIARILAKKGVNVIMLPGVVKAKTDAVVGSDTILALNKYNFNTGFFGTNGISKKSGFSTPDIEEARVKEVAIKRCKNVIFLADASKFDRISGVTFAKLDMDYQVLTDLNDPQKERKYKEQIEIKKIKEEE